MNEVFFFVEGIVSGLGLDWVGYSESGLGWWYAYGWWGVWRSYHAFTISNNS